MIKEAAIKTTPAITTPTINPMLLEVDEVEPSTVSTKCKTDEAPSKLPNPADAIPDDKPPLLIIVFKVEEIVDREGSVEVGSTAGVMLVTIVVEPLNTPTILTLEVSRMLSKAHKLLMKLVFVLLLLKKSLMLIAKWVVSCTVSLSYNTIVQSISSVTTKLMV